MPITNVFIADLGLRFPVCVCSKVSPAPLGLVDAIHIGRFDDHPSGEDCFHSGRYLLSEKLHKTVAGLSVLLSLGGILSIRNA
jgi:hypothetical protein